MKLFIDANIYLDFYNSNAVEYKKLLETITEAKSDIIITQLIVDEVVRNRSTKFKESFNNYAKNLGTIDCKLPVHIGSSLDTKVADWNKQRAKLANDLKTSNKALGEIKTKSLEEVQQGKDNVSRTFLDIFRTAIIPTEQQIGRARWRREIGNPPGKRSDVLGDQLSWEQLIDNLSGLKRLILVTKDSDYFTDLGNDKSALNPLLYEEISRKHSSLKVEVFNKLGPAFEFYNSKKNIKLKNLPSKEELKQIEKEEQIISASTASNFVIDHVFPLPANPMMELIMTNYCSVCGESTMHRDIMVKTKANENPLHRIMCTDCGSIR